MKMSNKVFVLIIACLLAVGALCLAFGIMLGGSLATVFQTVGHSLSGFGQIFLFLG